MSVRKWQKKGRDVIDDMSRGSLVNVIRMVTLCLVKEN